MDCVRAPRRIMLAVGSAAGLALWCGVMAGWGGGAAAHGLGDPLASACGVQLRAGVAPLLVTSGMTVSLRNQLVFSCPKRRRPFHLALVAWRPGQKAAPEAAWVPPAMARLAEDVRPEAAGWVAVGAVAYADDAVDLCPPIRDTEAVRACVQQLARPLARGDGSQGLGDAVYQAWKGLRLARAEVRLRSVEEPLRQSMVVVVPPSLPATAPGCAWARTALGLALADGTDVHLVCAEDGCAVECLDGVVAPSRRVAPAGWQDMARQLTALAAASELSVAKVELHEFLAPQARLVPGSSDPPHGAYDSSSGELDWSVAVPRPQALEVSYAVWPRGRGAVPVAGEGYLLFTDTAGRSGNAKLPARRVTVGWTAVLPLALRADLGISP